MNEGYYLIAGGICAIVVELFLGVETGFDLFIIGLLLIIGGVISNFSNFTVGVLGAVILSLIYIIFARSYIKKSLSIETNKTNVDGIIGKKATVVKDILPSHPGQVKIDGEVWRAESNTQIKKSEEVIIHSVTGVTLKVKSI